MEVARLLPWSAALLLLQSLIREPWLLSRARGSARPKGRKAAKCLCAESALGITIIVLATLLLRSRLDQAVMVTRWGWSLLVMGILLVGFLLREFVIGWQPWRIYREPGHLNLAARLRR